VDAVTEYQQFATTLRHPSASSTPTSHDPGRPSITVATSGAPTLLPGGATITDPLYAMRQRAFGIYERFIMPGATHEINLSSAQAAPLHDEFLPNPTPEAVALVTPSGAQQKARHKLQAFMAANRSARPMNFSNRMQSGSSGLSAAAIAYLNSQPGSSSPTPLLSPITAGTSLSPNTPSATVVIEIAAQGQGRASIGGSAASDRRVSTNKDAARTLQPVDETEDSKRPPPGRVAFAGPEDASRKQLKTMHFYAHIFDAAQREIFHLVSLGVR
jgi:hypothetical protein